MKRCCKNCIYLEDYSKRGCDKCNNCDFLKPNPKFVNYEPNYKEQKDAN